MIYRRIGRGARQKEKRDKGEELFSERDTEGQAEDEIQRDRDEGGGGGEIEGRNIEREDWRVRDRGAKQKKQRYSGRDSQENDEKRYI